MTWLDLLFAHWPVDAAAIQRGLPPGLTVDTFEGRAFLGVVPFRMEHVGPRGLAFLPGVSRFCELNVRTYVRGPDGRSGVWFYSLDAHSPVAVAAARALFGLPYYRAHIELRREGDTIHYASRRIHPGIPGGELDVSYGPSGVPTRAAPGSLEHWLVERYRLYAFRGAGSLRSAEIAHAPWPLQPAGASFRRNTVADAQGLGLDGAPELLHFAARLDVVAWWPEPAAPQGQGISTLGSRNG